MKLKELHTLAREMPNIHGPDIQRQLVTLMRSMGMEPGKVYQELEMTSRYVDTHRDTSYAGAHMQLHSHTFYELLYCRSSCGAEYLVGPDRYRLQRGDIIFVPPGTSHRPLLPENMDQPYERYVLWLSPEFMDMYTRLLASPDASWQMDAGLLRTSGAVREELGKLFRTGVQEAENQQFGWEAAVLGNTVQLLTKIRRAADDRSIHVLQAESPILLDQITAYIEVHYHETLSISQLAGVFYVSGSTISHLFKEKLGVSFYRYVTQRRLIAAKQLIGQGILLEDAARQVGFADYSGFYRAFKQEYGISPRDYRSLIV